MSPIFISYSHTDREYAEKLGKALEQHGLSTWIDDRIDYGTQWPHIIEEHIDSSSAFVVIMTPRAHASNWVQSELARARRKKKVIFPLLLEGEQWLSVEAIQYVDVRGGRLPPRDFYRRLAQVVASGYVQETQIESEPVRRRLAWPIMLLVTLAVLLIGIVLIVLALGPFDGSVTTTPSGPEPFASKTATVEVAEVVVEPVTQTPEPTATTVYGLGLVAFKTRDDERVTLNALLPDGTAIPLLSDTYDLELLAISPDGRHLAIAVADEGVLYREDPLYPLLITGESVTLLVVSSDGRDSIEVVAGVQGVNADYRADGNLMVTILMLAEEEFYADTITYKMTDQDGGRSRDLYLSENMYPTPVPEEEVPAEEAPAEQVPAEEIPVEEVTRIITEEVEVTETP